MAWFAVFRLIGRAVLLRFPTKLSTEIVDYLRAQTTGDAHLRADGMMFSVGSAYSFASTHSFYVMPTLFRLLRLRRRLPVAVVADGIRKSIEECDEVFEWSQSTAAQLNQVYDGGWRVQVSRPTSVTVTVTDKQITARLDGAAGESIEFGPLDVAPYV